MTVRRYLAFDPSTVYLKQVATPQDTYGEGTVHA
jgi:hypothetical protein